MTELRRRDLIGLAALVPVAMTMPFIRQAAAKTSNGELMLYDPSLDAGAQFAQRAAALGGKAHALVGDRVMLLRSLLSDGNTSIFGVSRYADFLQVADFASEQRFRETLFVHHKMDGSCESRCQKETKVFGQISKVSAADWPAIFAEMAVTGARVRLDQPMARRAAGPSMSWLFVKQL